MLQSRCQICFEMKQINLYGLRNWQHELDSSIQMHSGAMNTAKLTYVTYQLP